MVYGYVSTGLYCICVCTNVHIPRRLPITEHRVIGTVFKTVSIIIWYRLHGIQHYMTQWNIATLTRNKHVWKFLFMEGLSNQVMIVFKTSIGS